MMSFHLITIVLLIYILLRSGEVLETIKYYAHSTVSAKQLISDCSYYMKIDTKYGNNVKAETIWAVFKITT